MILDRIGNHNAKMNNRPQKQMPKESELVLCTVAKIFPHCVFVNLDEMGHKQGMIHISEISPGRIRNIHDYVRLGKKIVCKVLKVDAEKGHIDLSLRRVSEAQKREKAEEIKRQQKVEKIIEFVAEKAKVKPDVLYSQIKEQISKEYENLHDFFEDYVSDESVIKILKLPKGTLDILCETIKQRIKPPRVEIEGDISLQSYAPDGVKIIKKILSEAEKVDDAINIRYKGAGKYSFAIIKETFKQAEDIISKMNDTLEKNAKKFSVDFKLERQVKGKKASA